MFATLLLIRHVIDGGREATALEVGSTLAAELMRLYPQGLGPFDVYLREVRDENRIPHEAHETERIIEGERYILVLRPGAVALPFLINFAIGLLVSVAVSVIVKALTPKAQQPTSNAQTEAISPNNALAGQTNTLRPGARVPEILGKMRCYPDLIANAQETWFARTQWIVEWFVLGVGDYQLSNARLGETALAGITGGDLFQYRPGMTVPPILCVKKSTLVDNLALLTESPISSGGSTTFTPATMTMSTTAYLPFDVGAYGLPVRVDSPLNARLFDFRSGPPQTQTDPPFAYSLVGNMLAETTSAATFKPTNQILSIPNPNISWDPNVNGAGDIVVPDSLGWTPQAGQVVRIYFNLVYGQLPVANYVGIIGSVRDEGFQFRFWMSDFSMQRVVITRTGENVGGQRPIVLIVYQQDYGETVTRQDRATGDTLYTTWTDWMTAPFSNPQQLLIDIAFPQGLVWFYQGNKRNLTVSVQAQFKRLDASGPQATMTWTYTYATQAPLRFTQAVTVSDLGLAGASSPYIQVRLMRTTAWKADDQDNQYVWDTRWQAFSAATQTPSRVYSNVTLLRLTLQNSRAASSIGETSMNVIATRVLPTWTPMGGGMWLSNQPTERWADALVARMKAFDGANKTDADIDLAGIYAIQQKLDAMDGGDQGRIAMTLDQQQDIDTELQSIASVARCQLYRIGARLFCQRDEGGKAAIALFTGRSKHPDGETVSVNLTSDADPDAVIVPWWDRSLDAWKQREYQYPENITPINPLRIAPLQATWAQAWRRALYEWNRLTKRRETLTVKATEEASLVHPGDVINIADDVGNLSQTAGEVIQVGDPQTLRLDQEVDITQGSWVILLRSLDGRTTDSVPLLPNAQVQTDVQLARAPTFSVKGRDDGLGTMFAIYPSSNGVVIPWLVSSVEPEDRYLTISAMNWTEAVFAGDYATLPAMPIVPFTAELIHPMTSGVTDDEEIAREQI